MVMKLIQIVQQDKFGCVAPFIVHSCAVQKE